MWQRPKPRSAGRLVGLGAQQIRKDVAFVGRELALVARRVEHGGALIEGHRAQILEGALDRGLAIRRQRHKAVPGLANLHLLLRRHALQHLAPRKAALALRIRHLVQLLELLHQPLLLRGGQAIEAGIAAEQALLFLRWETLVMIEPVA